MREEVGNGIKIENIMKRLKHLSKEKLLEIMDVQVQKYPEAPDHLKEKIKKVRIAYRMFKKYKNIFDVCLYELNELKNEVEFSFESQEIQQPIIKMKKIFSKP